MHGPRPPTVIFESGLADPTGNWSLVQPRIAQQTRSCAYDRAGAGFSDPGTRAGSSAHIVDDLKRLLVAAAIEPPYVLVGHSYGGMNARLYYYTHPAEVAGMVLVDPSHEDQSEGYRMLSPRGLALDQWLSLSEPQNALRRTCAVQAKQGFVPGSEAYQRCVFEPPKQLAAELQQAYLAMQQKPAFHLAQLTEDENIFSASTEQLRQARRSFVDLPVVVLTQAPSKRALRKWETAALRAARERMWYNLHQGLADGSSRGVHRVVADSDHSIPLSQPSAVIGAIQEILATVATPPAKREPQTASAVAKSGS